MSRFQHGVKDHALELAIRAIPDAADILGSQERPITGDIFFPGAWSARPDYPPRLRAKILQEADLLFRAAAL